MAMQNLIVVDKKKIKLNQSDVLGVGGEATVVGVGRGAVKLFHKPNNDRAEKLLDFMKLKLPPNVCSPVKLAYDSTGRKVIGFLMNRLSPQYEVIQMLASKKYRRKHPSINSSTITDILLSGYDTIAQLHPLGVVVGDNNDLNALFWKNRMVYIDADSFQIKHHPCMVGTENFLDPRLYDVDLGLLPRFIPNDDWYAWFVMYIRSILMVHPYGGVHNKYKTVPQRAKAKVTFNDSSVKYPKAGFHPNLLNDDLKGLFDRMFGKGERFVPPREVFENYRDSLKKCLSCNTMYPAEYSSCPQCAKVNTQQVQRQMKIVKTPGKRTMESECLISTPGEIIWHHLVGRTVYAIANENQNLVFYCYSPLSNVPLRKVNLMPFSGAPKFDFFGGKYLVYNDGVSDYLKVFDISEDKIPPPQKLVVDSYQGDRVFACSKDHLFRVYQGFLFRYSFDARFNKFVDDNITAVSKNQTWIAASSHSTMVFGCQRFFEDLKFFTHRFNPTGMWYSPIAGLQTNESIIDVSTQFTSSSVLLMLQTEIKGRTYVHIYVLHEDQVKFHSRVEAISSDVYRNIHGKAFGVSSSSVIILHPTDDGVVQEIIKDGQSTASLLSETERFVSENDAVDQYWGGILVTGDNSVNYLTIS